VAKASKPTCKAVTPLEIGNPGFPIESIENGDYRGAYFQGFLSLLTTHFVYLLEIIPSQSNGNPSHPEGVIRIRFVMRSNSFLAL
jgi:hypothetical protein